MKIHPFAECFPMLPEEQLAELAADIEEHGQINPIITDAEGVLIDGRNRLAACKMVNVEPRIEVWHGKDPVAYILSANVHRRHIPKSVQAMALAIAYPEPAKLKRRSKLSLLQEFSKTLLMQARAVLHEFGRESDIVEQVLHSGSLGQAYEQAKERQRERKEREHQLEHLRSTYPEFAEKVENKEWSLGKALTVVHKIQEREEIAKSREALKLVQEQIGEERPIVITNHEELGSDVTTDPIIKKLDEENARGAHNKGQHDQLMRIVSLKHQLEEFSKERVYDQGEAVEAHWSAVRSSCYSIMRLCEGIALNYKKTVQKTPRLAIASSKRGE